VERNIALLEHRLLNWLVVIDVKLVLLFAFLLFGGEGRVAAARSKGVEWRDFFNGSTLRFDV